MIILGIDPGTAITGYGLLEVENFFSPRLVDYGCIRTFRREKIPRRLTTIYEKISEIIFKFHPQEVAIEEIFFNKNVKTALSVGQARGVIILAAYRGKGEIFEYTPLQIKQAITGYGRARKEQVRYMVGKLLHLNKTFLPDDIADAIAVALCHCYHRKLEKLSLMKESERVSLLKNLQ